MAFTTPSAAPAELLAPAGSPEALDAAIGEGADGVYLGLRNFNARLRSANFAYSQFEGALRALHRMGRKLYVTVNTVFEQREADRMYQLLKYLSALGPDGLIIQDFGIVPLVREHFPSLKLHASTQMNIAAARGTNLLSKHGFSRAVLARELSLPEIREIRGQTNLELEVFVHGALCVSASGLCLFSSYLGGKSANRGMCTQACRRLYRQGEDQGYYFSPADLQLLEQIPALVDAGVNSFKIEGRMRSAEYVGAVVAAYRRVLDSLDRGPEGAIAQAQAILRGDFARSKTAFYHTPEAAAGLSWLNPRQDGGTGIPLGAILKVKGTGTPSGAGTGRRALIPAGPLMPEPGDTLRFHRADDSKRRTLVMPPDAPRGSPGSPHKDAGSDAGSWISCPEGFEIGDSVYLIRRRSAAKRYPAVIRDLDRCRRAPGRETAPERSLPPLGKQALKAFPEGLYSAVSGIGDLYVLQSVRPLRVMLALTRGNAARLLEGPLPFSPGEIILVLDPYFPQSREAVLEGELRDLMAAGYRQFVVNNPGHFSYFRAERVSLIAGPFLYTFNRWAASFVASLGADFAVTPLENNRQNLERTVEPGRRAAVFVTLFAYPALFRIRADLSGRYGFGSFQDSQGERFRLNAGEEGSAVIPERPFYIGDKLPFLRTAGFRRFILDFSGSPLKKRDYRDIMAAVREGRPLPNTSRFNWKDGFYSPQEGVPG
ncbi:MAG: U32 family peptidase [Spirochaetaceae bacterium]|jgi:putative protease|nr:U32 family peptidase [Spirochaetaceae bacterium]